MPTIFRDKVEVLQDGVLKATFNDPLLPPLANGVVSWGLDVMLGWDTTPELTAAFTELGAVDGEVFADFFPAKGRQLNVGGWAMAVDRETADALRDHIIRDAFPRNRDLTVIRYESIPKFVVTRRNGPVDVAWVGPTSFRWSTEVRAPIPFKYGMTSFSEAAGVAGQSSGGRSYPRTYPLTYTTIASGEENRIVVNNVGTADTRNFSVAITGPLSKGSWRIVNETVDGLLRFDIGLASTDMLTIDFNTEIALLNGYPVTATITGDFFPIVPGVNILKLYGDYDSAVSFTVTGFSAWE